MGDVFLYLLYSRKFSSAKIFVESDRNSVWGSSLGIYFRQTSTVARLLCGRLVIALLLIVYLHNPEYCSTCDLVKTFVRN